jgi:putative nucleotidyltransferase with HDIG domain
MKYFEKEYLEYINEMKETPQHLKWHGEGNVYNHTKLVLKELEKIEEYNLLSEKEKEILRYAAFFHDISKYETTKEESGILRSHGHSKLGEKKTRVILKGYSFKDTKRKYKVHSHEFIEEVCMLVRYHGYPIHYYEKNENDIIRISLILNTKYLYILSKADLLGRITSKENIEESLMSINYYMEKAIEKDCFGKKKKFNSELEKFSFLESGYLYNQYSKNVSTIYLMVGIPGSGKDFYIRENLKDMNIISLDNFRKELSTRRGHKKDEGLLSQKSKEIAKKYLREGTDFVWNATNTNKDLRSGLITLFRKYKAIVKIIYIERDLEEIFKDNKNRENSVPKEYILKKFKFIDIPNESECHFLEKICY